MRAPKTDTEMRKEQITQAALDLIAAKGIGALSIAAIAERVGFVPSAVYRHFKAKDDVIDAVLELLKTRLVANAVAVRQETPEALDRLKALLMRHVRMLDENRAFPHVVFSDVIYTGGPERKAKVASVFSSYLGQIQEIVRDGQGAGTIRTDITPKTVSAMFMGLILPGAVLLNVSGGCFDVLDHAENCWPAFERGIRAES